MSRRKQCLPMTYVLGASVVLDRNEETNRIEPVIAKTTMRNPGHGDVPYVKHGEPMWRKPKPLGFTQHFKNEAAARRCNGDLRTASPKDLKIVPFYRGIPMRLANELLADKRKEAEKEERRKAAMSITERALASLGIGKDEGTKYA